MSPEKPKTILIAHPNEVIAQMLTLAFQTLLDGVDTSITYNQNDTREILQDGPIDFAVIDGSLLDLWSRLNQEGITLPPTILITSTLTNINLAMTQELKLIDTLQGPCIVPDLIDKIRRELNLPNLPQP